MSNFVMDFLLSHKDFIAGIVAGYALSHIPQVVGFLFDKAMKVPFIRSAILRDPDGAKKIIDEIEQALDKEIDEEIAAEKAKQEKPK